MAALKILGICGSLREKSYNKKVLETLSEMTTDQTEIIIFDRLGEIPLYNEDVEKNGDPDAVADFKKQIKTSDALLIATPEYNYNIPGVLKNAIDWASRPPSATPLKNKPIGIVGATQGTGGTIRCQLALRQVLLFTGSPAMMKPEVLISKVQEKFDENGKIKDEATKKFLHDFLKQFESWIPQQLSILK